MAERTTIALSPVTKQRLARFGEKDESFDHILRRLMEEAGWVRQEARWNRILAQEEFTALDEA